MVPINHAVYGNFTRQPSQLSAEEVGKFYDNFVLVSVDVIPTIIDDHGKKVLLGLRCEEPKSWWTVGRGMVPGEAPVETAIRALQEEFEINAESQKFKLACINSSVFPLRKQPPQENGKQCLTLVFSMETTANKINLFISKTGKYQEIKWFRQSEITRENFDPSIYMAISQI